MIIEVIRFAVMMRFAQSFEAIKGYPLNDRNDLQ